MADSPAILYADLQSAGVYPAHVTQLRFGKEIGRGGFCMVHEAYVIDPQGNPVTTGLAVKRLRDDLNEPEEIMQQLRHRFEREARLLDDELDHPNIVAILFRNLSGDVPYFVMPMAEGNLKAEIASHTGNEGWVIGRFRAVLEAMAYAHGKSIIHRDITPANVLLVNGVVKVSDFGLGKELDGGTAGLTKTFFGAGTEPYMAPEQFSALKSARREADVFALGKLLMEMLTGDEPVVGVPDVSDIPERFRYFVSRCCEQKPENRFNDAREALSIFDRVVQDQAFAEVPADTLQRFLEAWFATPSGPDLDVVREIDQLLRSSAQDESLFTKEVPRLPEDVVDQYMDELPDAFGEMLRIYDRHISGGLPFEYCDVVTDFYERIYRRTDRLDLRKMILIRLLEMGYHHNRWHVQTRGLVLLSEIAEPSTVAMAADAIRTHAEAARWFGDPRVASHYALPTPVREAFSEVQETFEGDAADFF